MIPFDNAFAQLSIAVGKINAALVNKLEAVEDVKPSAGTVHELNKRNSYGRFSAVGFRGTVDASYDRIDLTKFLGVAAKQDIRVTSRSKPATSHQALGLMNRKWQLGMPVDSVNSCRLFTMAKVWVLSRSKPLKVISQLSVASSSTSIPVPITFRT